MLRYERVGVACIVHVDFDLDIGSSPAVEEMIRRVQHDDVGDVVLSLEKCAYIDSTGISVMIRAHKALQSRFVVAVAATSQCRRILDVCGVPQIMRVVATILEALSGEAVRVHGDQSAAG